MSDTAVVDAPRHAPAEATGGGQPKTPEDGAAQGTETQKTRLAERARAKVKEFTAGIKAKWRREAPEPALQDVANGADSAKVTEYKDRLKQLRDEHKIPRFFGRERSKAELVNKQQALKDEVFGSTSTTRSEPPAKDADHSADTKPAVDDDSTKPAEEPESASAETPPDPIKDKYQKQREILQAKVRSGEMPHDDFIDADMELMEQEMAERDAAEGTKPEVPAADTPSEGWPAAGTDDEDPLLHDTDDEPDTSHEDQTTEGSEQKGSRARNKDQRAKDKMFRREMKPLVKRNYKWTGFARDSYDPEAFAQEVNKIHEKVYNEPLSTPSEPQKPAAKKAETTAGEGQKQPAKEADGQPKDEQAEQRELLEKLSDDQLEDRKALGGEGGKLAEQVRDQRNALIDKLHRGAMNTDAFYKQYPGDLTEERIRDLVNSGKIDAANGVSLSSISRTEERRRQSSGTAESAADKQSTEEAETGPELVETEIPPDISLEENAGTEAKAAQSAGTDAETGSPAAGTGTEAATSAADAKDTADSGKELTPEEKSKKIVDELTSLGANMEGENIKALLDAISANPELLDDVMKRIQTVREIHDGTVALYKDRGLEPPEKPAEDPLNQVVAKYLKELTEGKIEDIDKKGALWEIIKVLAEVLGVVIKDSLKGEVDAVLITLKATAQAP